MYRSLQVSQTLPYSCITLHVHTLGVSDGQTIRVPVGHTEAYIILNVQDSETFTRDGFDVHSDVTVSFTQAILGGSVRAQGLNGYIDVKVC